MKVYIVMSDHGIVRKVTTDKQAALNELKVWSDEIVKEMKEERNCSANIYWNNWSSFLWKYFGEYVTFEVREYDVEMPTYNSGDFVDEEKEGE